MAQFVLLPITGLVIVTAGLFGARALGIAWTRTATTHIYVPIAAAKDIATANDAVVTIMVGKLDNKEVTLVTSKFGPEMSLVLWRVENGNLHPLSDEEAKAVILGMRQEWMTTALGEMLKKNVEKR